MIDNYKKAKEILKEAVDYNNGLKNIVHVEDLITELADMNVDVYTSDLYKWAGTNIGHEYTQRALNEFGWDGVGKELVKAYMMGQYIRNEELLFEALEELKTELED